MDVYIFVVSLLMSGISMKFTVDFGVRIMIQYFDIRLTVPLRRGAVKLENEESDQIYGKR